MTSSLPPLKSTPFAFFPGSVHSKTFFILTAFEATIDIVLETVIIIKTDLIPSLHNISLDEISKITNPLTVYLGIFILAHVFQLYYAFDALRHKNTIQLIGLCGLNLAILTYAVIQMSEIKEIENHLLTTDQNESRGSSSRLISTLLTVIPLIVGTCQIGFSFLTWNLFKEFGWQIYKQIGADRKLKRIFMVYQIFMCLLKFDYFFFIAFCLQLVLLVPSVSVAERVLTIIAVPTTLVFLVLGYYGVRTESEPVIWGFQVGLLSGSSYFVYKLFRIWKGRNDPRSYQNVFRSLTVFSVLCFLMTLLSFTLALASMKNFGKGLKVHMDDQRERGRKRSGAKRRGAKKDEGLGTHFHLSSQSTNIGSIGMIGKSDEIKLDDDRPFGIIAEDEGLDPAGRPHALKTFRPISFDTPKRMSID